MDSAAPARPVVAASACLAIEAPVRPRRPAAATAALREGRRRRKRRRRPVHPAGGWSTLSRQAREARAGLPPRLVRVSPAGAPALRTGADHWFAGLSILRSRASAAGLYSKNRECLAFH